MALERRWRVREMIQKIMIKKFALDKAMDDLARLPCER
jgi:hypothetical protein